MDFELPEELKILQATVRRFVDNELIPIEQKSLENMKLKPEYRADLEAKIKKLGLWHMDVPEEYGGLGMGVLATSVVVAEMGRTIALPPRGGRLTGPEVRPALYNLTGEMKERYLFPVIRGEKRACFAQTEPDSGSDPGAMRTTAVRDGDSYVINGVKHYINNANEADFAILLAATDRSKGSHGGISAFIVDMDAPGVSLPTNYKVVTGETLWKIVFDDVRVPASHIILGEGKGFAVGQSSLGLARIRQGARAIGVTERCLELATSYAKQRVTFGKPLSERQSIQWMLVDSFVDLHLARLMVYNAAARADRGEDVRTDAYMTKLFCTEMAYRATDRCLQVHGGAGLMTDLPIERMWRDQRSHLIGEGTTEIMRMVLSREMFRQYT